MPTLPTLPDAEQLLDGLVSRLRGAIGADTALVGIHTGGVWVAERLHAALALTTPLGTLDVAFYRDDFRQRGLKPDVRPSELPFEIAGRDIILVDDVLYTGRTVRAALNLLFDYGRPGRVRLAALLDRGGRQLPIAAEWVGDVVDVPADRGMIVLVRDASGRLSLTMEEAGGGA
jgi:pyrimidine operon attenuation protein / uracil phosphoribosyltransferase